MFPVSDFHFAEWSSIWQLKKKKIQAFHPFHLVYCWLVDHRLSASFSFECWRVGGKRFLHIVFIVSWWHIGGIQISKALKSTSMWLSMFGQLLSMLSAPFFLDTPTLCDIPTVVVACLTLSPHPGSLPLFLYFWHQTFWARRPQHNVNYSAWLARGWERIINRRWSQAISYGWPWLNTNAQNHFPTHTNIRFHYLYLGERVFDFELTQYGLFVVFKCALCACSMWHVKHL